MSNPTSEDPLDDPTLRAKVDRALQPYRGELSEEALAAMRRYLEDVLLTHPLGRTLLQRVRPREPRAKSDERARADALEPANEPQAKRRTEGTK